MKCLIIGTSVEAFLFLTGTMKHEFVPRSTPPKTQTPFLCLPRLYFPIRGEKIYFFKENINVCCGILLFPNIDSSISTTTPNPPIGSESTIHIWTAISRHFFVHNGTVALFPILRYSLIFSLVSPFHQKNVNATLNTINTISMNNSRKLNIS